jgi:hypothetical protein
MTEFVSSDTYEQKLHMLQYETLINKDVLYVILSYDCVCVKPGMAVNCCDKLGKIYYAMWMNTNSAIVYYHGWQTKQNEEVMFDKLSLRNREEIIESHSISISKVKNREQWLPIAVSLENEGFQLNRILGKIVYYPDFEVTRVDRLREMLFSAAASIFEE